MDVFIKYSVVFVPGMRDVQLHLCVEDSLRYQNRQEQLRENLVTQYLPIVEGNVIQIQGNRAKDGDYSRRCRWGHSDIIGVSQ